MTSTAPTPALGQLGFWRGGPLLTPTIAQTAERLGYGTVWIGGSPAAELSVADELLDATEHITVATGIVNIWTAPAREVASSFHRLEAAHPGRFLLGIGIGHRESQGEIYQKPYSALVEYLDVLDAEGVPSGRRMISALGPRTLTLAAERSAGTHPYMTTPVHTRFARGILGPEPLIALEQRLVLDEDPERARATARRFLERYLSLRNYRRTLESHGFTAADLDNGATDAAVDALAPHGDATVLTAAVRAQLDAGADHVCAQFLSPREDPTAALEALAEGFGLGG